MSNFSKDININKIIELIKSSVNKQTPDYKSKYRERYSKYLKKIAMSQYESYIDEQINREEEEEEVQEQVQVQVQVQEREKKPYNFIPLPCITSYWPTIEYKLAYEKIIQLIIDNTRDEAEAQTYIENLKRIRKNCNKYIDTRYKELKALKTHTIIIQGRLRQPLQEQQEEQLRQQKWKEQQQQERLQKEKERQEQEMSSQVLNYLEARARAEAREEGEAGEEEGGEEEAGEEGGEEEGGEEEGGEEEGGGLRGGKRKSRGKSKKVAKKPVVSQKKQSIYKEILGKQMKIYKMPDSRKEYVKYKGELLHISDYKDLMKQKAKAKTKAKKVTQQKVIAKTKATKVTKQKAKSKTKK